MRWKEQSNFAATEAVIGKITIFFQPENFDLSGPVSEFKKGQNELEHDRVARLVLDVFADEVQHADAEMDLLGKLGLLLRPLRPEICRKHLVDCHHSIEDR